MNNKNSKVKIEFETENETAELLKLIAEKTNQSLSNVINDFIKGFIGNINNK